MPQPLNVLGGLDDAASYKVPVVVATTGDMTNTMIGLPIIDGYQIKLGDRVLVWQNLDPITNGIYCADETTEILTTRGFLRHSEMVDGDIALTINLESGQSEWQPVQSVHTFKVTDQEMLQMKLPGHSSLTTMDHRWPVASTSKARALAGVGESVIDRVSKCRIKTSRSLGSDDTLIRAAPCSTLPERSIHSDALVELVGWFLTEGHIRKNNSGTISTVLKITQSFLVNPENVDIIIACLTGVFGAPVSILGRGPKSIDRRAPAWRWEINERGMALFTLNSAAGKIVLSHAPDKVANSNFIASLTRSQLELFVDTCIEADGTTVKAKGPRKSVRIFYQNRLDRVAPIQMACALLGIGTSISSHGESCFRVSLLSGRRTRPRRHGKIIRFSGTVWCPRTDNGTWLARRDGTMFYTGNTVPGGPQVVGQPPPVSTGAWTRAIDFTNTDSVYQGTQVLVTNGTTYAGQIFVCTSPSGPTFGATPITFSISALASGAETAAAQASASAAAASASAAAAAAASAGTGGAVSINLTGGTLLLTSAQANASVITFTGSLTSNQFVQFPAGTTNPKVIVIQQATLNGFTVFLRGGGGSDTIGVWFPVAWGVPVGITVTPNRVYWSGYETVPPATPMSYYVGTGAPGISLPPGWLIADGSPYPVATYDLLFNVIGYSFGGSGSTFNVPDDRGYVHAAADDMGTSAGSAGRLFNWTVDTVGGESTHLLSVGEMPSHTHTAAAPTGFTVSLSATAVNGCQASGVTGSAGGSAAHNNTQPTRTMLRLIRF